MKDIIREALEVFQTCEDREADNRKQFAEDIKFARLSEQWPEGVRKEREGTGRPCLTVNKVAPVIRQVVNDARLNRPAISVRPVDGKADKETAEIITGLIRNIEHSSDADIAYDTAIDNAVSGGFGYFRINLDYANDIDPAGDLDAMGAEAFELDIVVERIVNPLSVYGDPDSKSASSDDWNVAFVFEDMPRKDFTAKYPEASLDGFYGEGAQEAWLTDKSVRVAEFWKREKTEKSVVAVEYPDAETAILDAADYKKRQAEIEALGGRLLGPQRKIPSYKVTQYILTATEILETKAWPGRFIPIIPVYGDEVYCGDRRHLRSIIRDAKDANRMFNYWRTTTTELVALAPKVPYIGEEGAFDGDPRWSTANQVSHPFLEYKKGAPPPQRQPFDSIPAGALQEALNAADDIKATTGIYDASLGAKSNETSGKAITARQREGDVSSFHFIDNLTRSIRHAGRVILDLIPKVYSTPRIVRTLGEDGDAKPVPINGKQMEQGDDQGEQAEIQRIYDLRIGRYDLVVFAGPSFSTRREEAATQMMELIRSYPDIAPIIGDLLAKNLDWPGSDETAKRLEKMLPPQVKEEGEDPQLMQMQQVMQAMEAKIQDLEGKSALEQQKLQIEAYKAETERMTALQPVMGPEQIQALVMQTLQQLASPNDLPEAEGQPMPTGYPEQEGFAA